MKQIEIELLDEGLIVPAAAVGSQRGGGVILFEFRRSEEIERCLVQGHRARGKRLGVIFEALQVGQPPEDGIVE